MTSAVNVLTHLRNPDIAFSREDIKTAYAILKERADRVDRENALLWRIDDKVEFDSRNRRHPGLQIGKVIGLNQKTVKVRTDAGVTWTVTASVLRKAA